MVPSRYADFTRSSAQMWLKIWCAADARSVCDSKVHVIFSGMISWLLFVKELQHGESHYEGACHHLWVQRCVSSVFTYIHQTFNSLGDSSFPVASARAWNSLLSSVRNGPSLTTFRRELKTVLFRSSFDNDEAIVIVLHSIDGDLVLRLGDRAGTGHNFFTVPPNFEFLGNALPFCD